MSKSKEKINLSILALVLMIVLAILISPALSKEIFARSLEVPAKIAPSGTGEVSEFYQRINKYYESVKNLEIYKANEKFDRNKITKTPDSPGNPNEEKPKFLSKRKDLEKEGSIYIPRGDELMQEKGGRMSSGAMLRRPEITCLGHGIMLAGENGQIGHLNENRTMSRELQRAIEQSLVADDQNLAQVGTNAYKKIFVNLAYNEVIKNDNPNIKWTKTFDNEAGVKGEIVGVDKYEDPERYEQLQSEVTQTLTKALEVAKKGVAEVIRQVELGRLDLGRPFSEQQREGNTPRDNTIRSTNRYRLREHRIGARLEKNMDPMGPCDTISPEAGYAINEIYIKSPEDSEFRENQTFDRDENRGGGDVQRAIWTTTEEGQRGEAWYGRGFPMSPDPSHPKSYEIIMKAKDFKKYWEEFVAFCNDRKENNYPNQEVIHSKQRDKKLEFKGEVPKFKPKEIVIKNPGVKYEPRFVEVNGQKPEDRKSMQFDEQNQQYIVGPYQLDYVSHYNESQSGKAWLAALTNAKIYGRYDNDENGGNNWKNDEKYKKYKEAREKYEKAIEDNNKAKAEFAKILADIQKELTEYSRDARIRTPEEVEKFKKIKEIYDKLVFWFNEIYQQNILRNPENENELQPLLDKINNLLQELGQQEKAKSILEKMKSAAEQLSKLKENKEKEYNAGGEYYKAKEEWSKRREELVKEQNRKNREEEHGKQKQNGNVDGDDPKEKEGTKQKKEDLGNYKIKFHKERSKEKNNQERPWRTVVVGNGSNLSKDDIIEIDAFKDKNNETYVVIANDGESLGVSGKEISISVSSDEEVKANKETEAKVFKFAKNDERTVSKSFNAKVTNLFMNNEFSGKENNRQKIETFFDGNNKNIGLLLASNNQPTEGQNEAPADQTQNGEQPANQTQNGEQPADKQNQTPSETPKEPFPTIQSFDEWATQNNKNKENNDDKAAYIGEVKAKINQWLEKNKTKADYETAIKEVESKFPDVTKDNKNLKEEYLKELKEKKENAPEGNGQDQNGQDQNGGQSSEKRKEEIKLEDDDDAEINITDPEIKGWKFLIKNVKPEEREYYVPLPGEEFYFVIPYDQNLRGISTIKIEFYHMVYGGEAKLYEGTSTVFTDLEDDAKVNANITDDGLKLSVKSVIYGIKAKGKTDAPSQPLGYWASARWFEKTILILRADDKKPIPEPEPDPDPNPGPNPNPGPVPEPDPSLSRFMVPIGGMVWEDKEAGEKHLQKDNIYKAEDDELLKGIKVNVYRVIGEKEGESGIKNIIEKQKARLFKENSKEEADWDNIYTNEEGKWGPFDLHDVGFSELEKKKYSPDKHKITFEVEYLYDGIQYEPVIPMASMAGDDIKSKVDSFVKMSTDERKEHFVSSFGIENKEARRKYNLQNAEIAGVSEMDDEGKTAGQTVETGEDNKRTGKVTGIKYKKDNEASESGRTVSRYQREMPEENKEGIATGRYMYSSTLNLGIPYMFGVKFTNGENDKNYPNPADPTKEQNIKTSKPYMTNINFGLTERQKANNSLTKDLVSAKVIVNRKALNYIFDEAYRELQDGAKEGETAKDFINRLFTLQVNNDPSGSNLQYKLDIYKTDYIFRTEIYKNDSNEKSNDPNGIYESIQKDIVEERNLDDPNMKAYTEDTRKLDVYLTYRISLYNDPYMASNYDTYFTEITDYYTDDLVPVLDKEIEKVVEIDPLNAHNGKTDDVGPAPVDANAARIKDQIIKIATPKYKIYKDWQDQAARDANNMIDFTQDFKEFKWEDTKDSKEGYHILRSTDKKPELIVPAGGRADIYTNYRIKRDGFDERVGLDNSLKLGKMYNIAEISSFAEYDKKTGEAAGVVDEFSAPDNVNLQKTLEVEQPLLDKSMFEADTDGAPIIKVDIPEEDPKPRKMSGILWEDFRNTENGGIRTGNGIKEDEEMPIPNQKVILEERVSIRKDLYNKKEIINDDGTKITLTPDGTSDYVDIPFVWPEKISTTDGEINLKELTGLSSIIKTGQNGEYLFTGVPAGNFVVKTRYSASGEIEDLVKTVRTELDKAKRLPNYYNGIDFKSTLFYGGDKEKVNTTWLGKIIDGDKSKYSYLRDDEFRRLEITDRFKTWATTLSELIAIYDKDLENATDVQKEILKNAHDYSHMVAVTPKINYSIEFYEKYTKDGKELPNLLNLQDKAYAIKGVTVRNESSANEIENYDVENINLSIVERPQTKLVLNKEIENIEYITNNGKKSFSADFKTDLVVSRKEQEYNRYIQDPGNVSFKTVIDRESKENERLEETLSFENTLYELDGLNLENAKYAQKFAYLNIDEMLLQGSTINVKYKISVYNLSENDRKIDLTGLVEASIRGFRGIEYYTGKEAREKSGLGKLKHEYASDKEYRFGIYVGDEYYAKVDKPLEKNDIAKAKINGILDIMSTTMKQNENHEKAKEWMQMSRDSLVGVLQRLTSENVNEAELLDKRNNRNVPYIDNERSNIFGRFETKEKEIMPIDNYIKPGEQKHFELSKDNKDKLPEWMRIFEIGATATTATLGTPGDFMYENSAEIVQYTMDTARRAVGNAPGSIFTDLEKDETTLFESTAKQYDADTPEYITVTPPTGLNLEMKKSNKALIITTVFAVVVAIGGISIKTYLNNKDKKEKYFANRPWER